MTRVQAMRQRAYSIQALCRLGLGAPNVSQDPIETINRGVLL
jgi:hypothetical protein